MNLLREIRKNGIGLTTTAILITTNSTAQNEIEPTPGLFSRGPRAELGINQGDGLRADNYAIFLDNGAHMPLGQDINSFGFDLDVGLYENRLKKWDFFVGMHGSPIDDPILDREVTRMGAHAGACRVVHAATRHHRVNASVQAGAGGLLYTNPVEKRMGAALEGFIQARAGITVMPQLSVGVGADVRALLTTDGFVLNRGAMLWLGLDLSGGSRLACPAYGNR